MKQLSILIATIMLLSGCVKNTEKTDSLKPNVSETTIGKTIADLKKAHPEAAADRIERGVRHAATIWWPVDGNEEAFSTFCTSSFVSDPTQLNDFFNKVSRHFETLYGHYNWMALKLQEPVHLKFGDILPIDEMFSGYNPAAHLQDDLYANKIAFIIALNFPYYSLAEKTEFGKTWSRSEWAQARLGDLFTARVPARLQQEYAQVSSDADLYISQYNIHAGKLQDETGKALFPDDMVLLSHWNLRDELKANYPLAEEGLKKQKMIYEVMKHIIAQTIPKRSSTTQR
jgi:hypothetical protein